MRRLSTTAHALITGVLALLLIAYVFAGGRGGDGDRPVNRQVPERSEPDPEARCTSAQTGELIKRELFRRAADLRGVDGAAFDEISAGSAVRLQSPKLRSHDEEIGAISCSALVALDLPQGMAVSGANTLTAQAGYAIQAAADGSGDVLSLSSSADAIVTPLATLVRAEATEEIPETAAVDEGLESQPAVERDPPAPSPLPPAARPREQAAAKPAAIPAKPPARAPETAAPRPTPPRSAASPSFNCRYARTVGEIAVCNNAGLAILDRTMAAQFKQAMSTGTAAQRSLLERTRNRFLAYRDRCGSHECIANTYRDRMREISDIAADRWSP